MLLCGMRCLMPTLFAMGEEFPMNFEALGASFREVCCLSQHFCELEAYFAEGVCTQRFQAPIACNKPCCVGPELCRTSENLLPSR
jgi:hypothetical protein